MRLLQKLRRGFQKRLFPNERDLLMRRWKAAGGNSVLRLQYDLTPQSVVLDLGGYRGQWADEIYQRYGCTVHVFEPVRAFAQGIQRRFLGNPRIHVHSFGLGGRSRTETIGLSADASSVFHESSERETIEIRDIHEWLTSQSVQKIDLMKVNIEGGEYELIDRMLDTDLMQLVTDLQVQFHDFDANAAQRMQAIQDRLTSTHYPTYQYRFVWENWRKASEVKVNRAA